MVKDSKEDKFVPKIRTFTIIMRSLRLLLLFLVVLISISFPTGYCSQVSPPLRSDAAKSTSQDGKAFERLIESSNAEYEINGSYDFKGATVTVPEGCVLKSRNATISNGTIVLQSRCDLYGFSLNNVQILIDGVDGVRIADCSFTGDFIFDRIKAQNYTASAICCKKSSDVVIEHNIMNKYQWGVAVFDSYRIVIDNIVFKGVLERVIDYSENIENSNYHDAVHLSNTHYSRVCNVVAYNCGACVLLGRTSKYNVIESCKGNVLWDNGVYISSGNNNVVQSCIFNNVRGTGIKARGSCNIVSNNTVSNVGVGYVLTGNGLSQGKDEYGSDYNGYGSMVSGNSVKNAKYYGISIGEHDGLPPYRFLVVNNSIVNVLEDAASISVFCNGASIVGNNIFCPDAYGIVVKQYADKESGGYMISENNVNCKRRGIAIQRCNNSMITNNVVYADKQGIVVYQTRGSSFISNKFSGSGKYSVSGHIKGTSNYYKTLGAEDALKSSSFIVLEKGQ